MTNSTFEEKKRAADAEKANQEKKAEKDRTDAELWARMERKRASYNKIKGIPKWRAVSQKERAEQEKLINEDTNVNALMAGKTGNPAIERLQDGAFEKVGGGTRSTLIIKDGLYRATGGSFKENWETIVSAIAGQGFSTVHLEWNPNAKLSFKEIMQIMDICEDNGVAFNWGPDFQRFLESEFLKDKKPDEDSPYKKIIDRRDALIINETRAGYLSNISKDDFKDEQQTLKSTQEKDFNERVKVEKVDKKPTPQDMKNDTAYVFKNTEGDYVRCTLNVKNEIEETKLTGKFGDKEGELRGALESGAKLTNEQKELLFNASNYSNVTQVVKEKPKISDMKQGIIYFCLEDKGKPTEELKAYILDVDKNIKTIPIPEQIEIDVMQAMENKGNNSSVTLVHEDKLQLSNKALSEISPKADFQTPYRYVAIEDLKKESEAVSHRIDQLGKLAAEASANLESREKIINDSSLVEQTGRDKKGKMVKNVDVYDEIVNAAETKKPEREAYIQTLQTEYDQLVSKQTALEERLTALNEANEKVLETYKNAEDNNPQKKKAQLALHQTQELLDHHKGMKTELNAAKENIDKADKSNKFISDPNKVNEAKNKNENKKALNRN